MSSIHLSFSGKSIEDPPEMRLHPESNLNGQILTIQERAAIIIQKFVRGRSIRRGYLTHPNFSVYKPLCASSAIYSKMPKAGAGKTRVYIPEEASTIVLKKSGRNHAIERFHEMQKVRHILKSQRSSHLVIPKAALCNDFLVEARLPISTDDYINMGRYIDHPRAFDSAILELTRLLSEVGFHDIVDSSQTCPIQNIVGDVVRYDNLPLYIKDGVGKIGLIDLEGIFCRPLSQYPDRTDELMTLARIFPYHTDMILDEAKKIGMCFVESAVRECEKKGCKFLQVGYIDHLHWLQQRGITPQNAKNVLFEVRPERMGEIIQIAIEKLKSDERSAELIEESVRYIILETSLILNEDKLGLRNHKVDTDAEMVSYRSVEFSRKRLYKPKKYDDDWNVIETEENDWEKWDFQDRDQLFLSIFNELVRGGELHLYDLNFLSGGHERNWIRY